MNQKTDVLIASFLRIACEDLRDARVLAAHDSRNAIYLCEQAAEKVIRAVIAAEGKHAGIRHSLRQMIDDHVPNENPVRASLIEIAVLEFYATAYRYPTPEGRIPTPPVGEKFAELANKVEAVLREVASRFGVDFSRNQVPASDPRPIR